MSNLKKEKQRLNSIVSVSGINNPEALKQSQKLDKLIVDHMKKKLNKRGHRGL